MSVKRIDQELDKVEKSRGAVALQALSWMTLGGGFLVCTVLSVLGDMTPFPFDGSIFGELGGLFLAALFLKTRSVIAGGSS